MRPGNAIALLACIIVTAPSALASGGPPDFPAAQFGKFPKALNESLGGNVVRERLISGRDARYEPLRLYAPDSRLRKAASPVGLLDIKYARKSGTCTASLIAEDLILTNAHCTKPTVKRLMFFPEYFDDDGSEPPGYTVVLPPLERDERLDYAILRLTKKAGKRYGVLRLSKEKLRSGDDLSILHHPLGQPKSVTRYGCRVKAMQRDGRLLHLCDTMPGSSGSPVMTGDSRYMVGLHFAGGGTRRNPVNIARSVAELAKHSPIIRKVLAGRPAAVPRRPPPPREEPPKPRKTQLQAKFRNTCTVPVDLAVRTRGEGRKWRTHGFIKLAPGAISKPFPTNNRYVYWVAESTNGTKTWEANAEDRGRNLQQVGKRFYLMKLMDLDKGPVMNLNCSKDDLRPRWEIRNRCNTAIDVAMRVQDANKQWRTHGWYELEVGETLSRSTTNRLGYYYAHAHDPKLRRERKLKWGGGEGSNPQTVRGRKVEMRRTTWKRDVGVTTLICTN